MATSAAIGAATQEGLGNFRHLALPCHSCLYVCVMCIRVYMWWVCVHACARARME